MLLTKDETKRLQGIAIIFMLGLHLFNRMDVSSFYDVHFYLVFRGEKISLLTSISYIFDACVPIYLFCSGYGLYISEQHGGCIKKRAQRIFKLLIRFWIFMVITCIVGYFLGMRDRYPGSILNFFLNFCLIKSNYVGAFWFVQTYVILVLISGVVYKVIQRYSYLFVLPCSFALYIAAFGIEYIILNQIRIESIHLSMNALMLLLRSQFSFVLGMIFAKERLIDNIKFVIRIRESQILPWIILLVLMFVRANLTHLIFAPFSAIPLIIIFGTYNWGNIGEKIWLFFGIHSTNMWLTHMQFYMIFTPTLVFGSRNIFVIMFTLVGVSLAASYMVNGIYKIVLIVPTVMSKARTVYRED